MTPATEYSLDAATLGALAAACESEADASGANVLARLRAVPGFAALAPSAHRDHYSPRPGRLLDESGNTVADDFVDWAREQLATRGDNAAAVLAAFADKPWTVTLRKPQDLYFWLQRGARPTDGIQLRLTSWQEYSGPRLFSWWTYGTPNDLADLVRLGSPQDTSSPALGHARLVLRAAIDVDRFVALGDLLHTRQRAAAASRQVLVRPSDGTAPYESTLGQLHPEMLLQGWPPRRWFNDWAYSSAGRSGAVAGHRWAFDLTDWNGAMDGRSFGRSLSMVPLWTHRTKIAPLSSTGGLNDHELYGRLLKLDARTGGVPFGWFFYMLHGNLVKDAAGHRVLKMAEAGTIVLPEQDYRVLRAWCEGPYGF